MGDWKGEGDVDGRNNRVRGEEREVSEKEREGCQQWRRERDNRGKRNKKVKWKAQRKESEEGGVSHKSVSH